MGRMWPTGLAFDTCFWDSKLRVFHVFTSSFAECLTCKQTLLFSEKSKKQKAGESSTGSGKTEVKQNQLIHSKHTTRLILTLFSLKKHLEWFLYLPWDYVIYL